tara:strand:- start:343 stop:1248 length:906 start_codon:yes stop_codon:yes gene_type:complete
MSKIFIKVTFFIFSTLLAQPGKSILLLNQFDEQLPELNSSLDNNFSGSRFQLMEPIENLITDLDTSKYPAANRMGLVKQIGSEYKVDYIIYNQIQNQGNRFFLEGQIFSTRSGGLILRRKLDLLNYEDGRMNELNLWIGEIMEVLYPGWVENRESILFQDPDDITYEKTPMGAALRSLAIPGWGQAYSGEKLSAAFWGGLESSLSTAILLSFLNYNTAAKNFVQYQKDYNNTDDEKEIARYREMAIKEHAKHIRYNKLMIAFASITGTTWVANSVHAWIVGPRPIHEIYRSKNIPQAGEDG